MTTHFAWQIDKTPMKLPGEVKVTLSFGDYKLSILAPVTYSLDIEIWAGVPFCKHNNTDLHMGYEKNFP